MQSLVVRSHMRTYCIVLFYSVNYVKRHNNKLTLAKKFLQKQNHLDPNALVAEQL